MLAYDGIKQAMADIAAMQAAASPVQAPTAAVREDVPGAALTHCIMATLPPATAAALDALGVEQKDVLSEFEQEASTLVGAFVCLIDGSAPETEVRLALRNSPSGTAAAHLPVLALYDIAAATENGKYPAKSAPPWYKDKCEKNVRAFLSSRQSDDEPTTAPDDRVASLPALASIDTIMFLDQGRPSFQNAFRACLRGLPGKPSSLSMNIHYPEQAILARREQISGSGYAAGRGFMTLKQLEQVMIWQSEQYTPPAKRDNLFFEGTTVGDSISPVGLPSLTDAAAWKLSVGEKLKMLGADSLFDSAGVRPAEAAAQPRLESSVEPFNFHSRSPALYGELMHRTDCKVMVDLTASDGNLALTCLLARKPYVGLCHTAEHVKGMTDRLKALVFSKFYEVGNPLFKPALAQILQGSAPPEPPPPRTRAGPRVGRRRIDHATAADPLDPNGAEEEPHSPDFE